MQATAHYNRISDQENGAGAGTSHKAGRADNLRMFVL
jgi:hypothetical protein